MGWLPFRIHIWVKLTEQVFVRSTWTRGQDLAGQARRSHWRTCSVPSQKNAGIQLAICEQLTLLVALYIHDTVVRNGEPRRYSIIEKRMVHFRFLEQKIRDKEHSASRERTNRQTSSHRSSNRRTWTKGRKKKGLGDGCSVDLGRSMCRWEIFVWCQPDNHVRIVAVIQECSAPDVVASGSWMRKDDGE